MSSDTPIFETACEAYLARATIDPQWRELYRRSVEKLMAALALPERSRLLSYVNQLSVLNASFVVRRLASVYVLSLYPQEDEELSRARRRAAAENLAAFRLDFISPPPGEEEGKRGQDVPRAVFRAALRQIQGSTAETPLPFREMTEQSIEGVMAAFSSAEREKVHSQFEQFSVEGLAQVFRLWMWHQGEESRRSELARQQYEQWRLSADESYWWRYPQGKNWIYF
jgi:hypothetical protein